jgi:hypothetical protein
MTEPRCHLYVANVRQLIILPDGEKSSEPKLERETIVKPRSPSEARFSARA